MALCSSGILGYRAASRTLVISGILGVMFFPIQARTLWFASTFIEAATKSLTQVEIEKIELESMKKLMWGAIIYVAYTCTFETIMGVIAVPLIKAEYGSTGVMPFWREAHLYFFIVRWVLKAGLILCSRQVLSSTNEQLVENEASAEVTKTLIDQYDSRESQLVCDAVPKDEDN